MIRIFHNTNYDFIKWWKWAAGLTIAFLLLGVVSYSMSGSLQHRVTGGTMLQVQSRLRRCGVTPRQLSPGD